MTFCGPGGKDYLLAPHERNITSDSSLWKNKKEKNRSQLIFNSTMVLAESWRYFAETFASP